MVDKETCFMIINAVHTLKHTDKGVPNTPLRELIRQTPVIAASAVLLFLILCCLIFGIFTTTKCINWQRKKLESTQQACSRRVEKMDKYMDKTDGNAMFSRKASHIGKGDKERMEAIVDEIAVRSDPNPPARRRRLPLMGQSNDLESDNGQQHLFDDSRAVTKFLTNKLYTGLKHPQHGRTFRDIVEKVLEETRATRGEQARRDTTSQQDVQEMAVSLNGNTPSARNESKMEGIELRRS